MVCRPIFPQWFAQIWLSYFWWTIYIKYTAFEFIPHSSPLNWAQEVSRCWSTRNLCGRLGKTTHFRECATAVEPMAERRCWNTPRSTVCQTKDVAMQALIRTSNSEVKSMGYVELVYSFFDHRVHCTHGDSVPSLVAGLFWCPTTDLPLDLSPIESLRIIIID